MNNSVVIKGNKYGIMVVLDETVSFEELKKEVAAKFKESGSFFKKATMGVSFEGRKLTDDEIRELIEVISKNSEIHVACVIDGDKKKEEMFRQAVATTEQQPIQAQAVSVGQVEANQDLPPYLEEAVYQNFIGNEGLFYRGTLRSGQDLESPSSIIILGDVNPGAKVISAGNVVVLGTLKGTVYAGVNGNEEAFVVALEMNPMQIRIGDVIARCSSTKEISRKKKTPPETKIAFVENDNIYIEPLNKEILNDIHFN